MAHAHALIDMNIHFLLQGKELLQNISNHQYTFSKSPYFTSSAGKHMRHVLDHYISLINGYSSKIDYDARQRDARIEEDRAYAISQINACIKELKKMPNTTNVYNQAIEVRSNEADTDDDSTWSTSSVNRELQFLIGHTVHHYALIAFILRVQDFTPQPGFGVAPSTLKYERKQAQHS